MNCRQNNSLYSIDIINLNCYYFSAWENFTFENPSGINFVFRRKRVYGNPGHLPPCWASGKTTSEKGHVSLLVPSDLC